ncbi:MAG: phosphatidylserine decarboxylase [Candidatus Omnitrophota bacterium]
MNPFDEFQQNPFPRPRSWIERLADAIGLNRFFLREGRRPEIRAEENLLLSPVQGKLTEIQTLRASEEIRGKRGFQRQENYSFEEIVHRCEGREAFESGRCFNIYLSPLNLHYLLFPASMTVKKLDYHPAFCRPILFMKSGEIHNERLVIHGETASGCPIILILVGSFLVSGVECLAQVGNKYEKGALLGGFKLGSTVLMLLPNGRVEPLTEPGASLQMGEPIARFL